MQSMTASLASGMHHGEGNPADVESVKLALYGGNIVSTRLVESKSISIGEREIRELNVVRKSETIVWPYKFK